MPFCYTLNIHLRCEYPIFDMYAPTNYITKYDLRFFDNLTTNYKYQYQRIVILVRIK